MTTEVPKPVEAECEKVAQNRLPLLLVGSDASTLDVVARRIHDLTEPKTNLPPAYVSQSLRGP